MLPLIDSVRALVDDLARVAADLYEAADEGHEACGCHLCDVLTAYEHLQERAERVMIALSQDPQRRICGVVCACGPNGEPLACGYHPGHPGNHSWATLPTFAAAREEDKSGDVEGPAA